VFRIFRVFRVFLSFYKSGALLFGAAYQQKSANYK